MAITDEAVMLTGYRRRDHPHPRLGRADSGGTVHARPYHEALRTRALDERDERGEHGRGCGLSGLVPNNVSNSPGVASVENHLVITP